MATTRGMLVLSIDKTQQHGFWLRLLWVILAISIGRAEEISPLKCLIWFIDVDDDMFRIINGDSIKAPKLPLPSFLGN